MATRKTNRNTEPSVSNLHNFVSFSEIGGLSDHIKTLKELIIFPLLYENVYNKFKIRAPRGVLFYGPPGTGKTLVAGALAKECSKEINGKITFFNRKGADILNKWVGESEEKLRALFSEAAANSPSVIFFDEIDGLAPVRSSRQDQVHASVVATLLALMDGLDKLPGVVVIGATNRIDAIDPALRRPGRFDRELYFPLPAYNARREIIEVHISSWTVQPKPSFISYLADITAGYSGSDIQALCSEAVMSCLRRKYPEIHNGKTNIRMKNLRVNESDFMAARNTITPSTNREESHMRRLSFTIKPLLQRQLNQVVLNLKAISPHFMCAGYKYNFGMQRFSSKLLILGNSNQGHNTHIAPALLHSLEHLPYYVIDIQSLYKCASHTAEEICVQKLTQAKMNLPSIVLTYRLDEWWDIVEESTRAILVSMFKDIHAGLPLLWIVTVSEALPQCLKNFFNEPGSIIYVMENPNEKEKEIFFNSLFMDHALNKIKPRKNKFTQQYYPIHNEIILNHNVRSKHKYKTRKSIDNYDADTESSATVTKRKGNFNEEQSNKKLKTSVSEKTISDIANDQSQSTELKKCCNQLDISENNISGDALSDNNSSTVCNPTEKNSTKECNYIISGDSKISNVERIKYLFHRTVTKTSKDMAVMQLELLYDMLSTCINRENQDVSMMLENISSILTDFETKHTEITPIK